GWPAACRRPAAAGRTPPAAAGPAGRCCRPVPGIVPLWWAATCAVLPRARPTRAPGRRLGGARAQGVGGMDGLNHFGLYDRRKGGQGGARGGQGEIGVPPLVPGARRLARGFPPVALRARGALEPLGATGIKPRASLRARGPGP